MMERLIARGREIAAARVAVVIAGLAAAAADELPADVRVAAESDGVALSGRRLAARLLRDARLRGFAALARTIRR